MKKVIVYSIINLAGCVKCKDKILKYKTGNILMQIILKHINSEQSNKNKKDKKFLCKIIDKVQKYYF